MMSDPPPHWYDLEHQRITIEQAEVLLKSRDRIVAQTEAGCMFVSTVFLVLDSNLSGSGPPLLYATALFGPAGDGSCRTWRTSTRAAAIAMHDQVAAAARDNSDPGDVETVINGATGADD
jgi:hypothetical protein